MSRLLAVSVAAVAACACLVVTSAPAAAQPRAVLAFLPQAENPPVDPSFPRASILELLDAHPELSLGLCSACSES